MVLLTVEKNWLAFLKLTKTFLIYFLFTCFKKVENSFELRFHSDSKRVSRKPLQENIAQNLFRKLYHFVFDVAMGALPTIHRGGMAGLG